MCTHMNKWMNEVLSSKNLTKLPYYISKGLKQCVREIKTKKKSHEMHIFITVRK